MRSGVNLYFSKTVAKLLKKMLTLLFVNPAIRPMLTFSGFLYESLGCLFTNERIHSTPAVLLSCQLSGVSFFKNCAY
jgi:hypothetical protein